MAETNEAVVLSRGTSEDLPEALTQGQRYLETDTGNMKIDIDTSTRVQVMDDTKLPLAGGVLSGNIDMNSHSIVNVSNPVLESDVANKRYVDQEIIDAFQEAAFIPTSEKGAVNGVATLDGTGRLTAGQKPSYTADEVGAVPTSRTVNGRALSQNITLSAADVSAVPITRTVNGHALSDNISLTSSDVNAVPTSRTVNGHALSANVTLDAEDVGARPDTWTPTAADVGAVPTSRTINGHALSSNISLTATDVGAVPTSRTVNGKPLSANITLSAGDVSAVPTTRKVNNKALSADITLTAADIGARASTWMPTASDVGAVPVSRTVNGQALSSNVTLDAADVGAATTLSGTMTLPATGWTNNVSSSGYYYIDVSVSGMQASYAPDVTIVKSFTDADADDAMQESWNRVKGGDSRSGAIRFYATELPTVAVSLQWKLTVQH